MVTRAERCICRVQRPVVIDVFSSLTSCWLLAVSVIQARASTGLAELVHCPCCLLWSKMRILLENKLLCRDAQVLLCSTESRGPLSSISRKAVMSIECLKRPATQGYGCLESRLTVKLCPSCSSTTSDCQPYPDYHKRRKHRVSVIGRTPPSHSANPDTRVPGQPRFRHPAIAGAPPCDRHSVARLGPSRHAERGPSTGPSLSALAPQCPSPPNSELAPWCLKHPDPPSVAVSQREPQHVVIAECHVVVPTDGTRLL